MQVTGENSKVTFNAPYNDVTGTQNNQYHYHSNVIPEVDLGRESCSLLPKRSAADKWARGSYREDY